MSTKLSNLDSLAVQKLIQYLRIKTVHPEPDYGIDLMRNNYSYSQRSELTVHVFVS